jgi:hypothetical protein
MGIVAIAVQILDFTTNSEDTPSEDELPTLPDPLPSMRALATLPARSLANIH